MGLSPETHAMLDAHAFARLPAATPLHAAVRACDISKVRALLDASAPVNAVDASGESPLHTVLMRPSIGTREDRAAIARMLIDGGADLRLLYERTSLLGLAVHGDTPDDLHDMIAARLIKCYDATTMFYELRHHVCHEDAACLRVYARAGVDMNIRRPSDGATLLSGAVSFRSDGALKYFSVEMVRTLISMGFKFWQRDAAGKSQFGAVSRDTVWHIIYKAPPDLLQQLFIGAQRELHEEAARARPFGPDVPLEWRTLLHVLSGLPAPAEARLVCRRWRLAVDDVRLSPDSQCAANFKWQLAVFTALFGRLADARPPADALPDASAIACQ